MTLPWPGNCFFLSPSLIVQNSYKHQASKNTHNNQHSAPVIAFKMVSLKSFVTVAALIVSFVLSLVIHEEDDPDLILAGQIETQFGLVTWYVV